jgi:radical SAM protein with 4Fe4S-binding SPASM domain
VSLHSFDGIGRLEDYITPILDFADKASEKGILVNLRLWNKGKDNTGIEREINNRFPKRIAEKEGNITLKKGVFLDIAEEFGWPDLSLPDLADPVFCYGMRDQFAVLSNGIVTPCCLDAEGDIPLGNIFKEDLRSILNTTKAKNIYDGFTRATARESLCRKCPYAHEKFSSKAHHLSKNIYK